MARRKKIKIDPNIDFDKDYSDEEINEICDALDEDTGLYLYMPHTYDLRKVGYRCQNVSYNSRQEGQCIDLATKPGGFCFRHGGNATGARSKEGKARCGQNGKNGNYFGKYMRTEALGAYKRALKLPVETSAKEILAFFMAQVAHFEAVAQDIEFQPKIVREISQFLDEKVSNDEIKPNVAESIKQLLGYRDFSMFANQSKCLKGILDTVKEYSQSHIDKGELKIAQNFISKVRDIWASPDGSLDQQNILNHITNFFKQMDREKLELHRLSPEKLKKDPLFLIVKDDEEENPKKKAATKKKKAESLNSNPAEVFEEFEEKEEE